MSNMKDRVKRKGMRAGYSILELVFSLILIALILGGIYMAYKTLKLSSMTTKKTNEITTVIGAAERVRSANNDAFVAASNNIGSIPKMNLELGGSNGSRTIKRWTYKCADSYNTTLSMVTTRYISVDLRDAVLQKVNVDLAPWEFTASGSTSAPTITLEYKNVPCQ